MTTTKILAFVPNAPSRETFTPSLRELDILNGKI
jgi:hypothetical protein